jgi:polar amino acid transport system substrate-binding protein
MSASVPAGRRGGQSAGIIQGASRLMKPVIFVAALVAALVSGAVAQDLPDLEGRTIRAVTENAYTPLNFADPATGEGIGWEYDAMNEIGRRLNAKVEWNLVAWDLMIQAIREGQYDIGMDGISITDERKQQVDFSDPYMKSQQFMLVRADEARIKSKDDFASNTDLFIGAQAGTSNFYAAVYDVLDGDEANPRIKLFDTFGASVQALKSGDVDMVLMDQAAVDGYIAADPGVFKTVGEAIGSDEFGFILQQGSDLVGPVNAALASMKADGFIDGLNRKWFFEYTAAK